MDERMRQDERPRPCPVEFRVSAAPMADQCCIIDDVDIEAARSPRSAAAAPRAAFDRLQHSEQRLRRKMRVDQRDGIDVGRLAGIADRCGPIERRDGKNSDIEPFNFA